MFALSINRRLRHVMLSLRPGTAYYKTLCWRKLPKIPGVPAMDGSGVQRFNVRTTRGRAARQHNLLSTDLGIQFYFSGEGNRGVKQKRLSNSWDYGGMGEADERNTVELPFEAV